MLDKLKIKGTPDTNAIFHWDKSNSLRKTLTRYVPKEFELDFRTHNLRKTKLTKLLKEDKYDLPFIAKYARHADIKNTIKYVAYDENENPKTPCCMIVKLIILMFQFGTFGVGRSAV